MTETPVTVCRPDAFPLRRVAHCPTCKQRRRFAVLDAAWYGPRATCCHCGDTFGDGERLPRPCRRGWRTEAAAGAKQVWQDAGAYTHADWQRWLSSQLGAHAAP